jgi:lariat debranching enzyme
MGLLRNLQPTWWFAAHLHTRFEARVRHDPSPHEPEPEEPSSSTSFGPPPPPRAGNNPDEITISDDVEGQGELDAKDSAGPACTVPNALSIAIAPQNPDEITLEDEIETVEPPPPPPRETKFLALDKCLPRRQFLEASRPSLPAVGDTIIKENPYLHRW